MKQKHSLPAELCSFVERTPATVLLECALPAASGNGWTQLFTAPLRTVSASTSQELAYLFGELEVARVAGHVAAGYLAYEAGACFEPKAALPTLPPGQPLAWFGIYRRSYPFDHATGTFPDGEPPELAQLRAVAPSDLAENAAEVEAALPIAAEEYARRIEAIHNWIRSGDIYQLNYTVPLNLQLQGNFTALYRRLRQRQPVPYGAFLHTEPGHRILSLSPELFFRLDESDGQRHILTRPMKGTAPRGCTTAEDLTQARWLKADEKNRAENLMIADLLRNDLGRLARFGSVRVQDLFAVERHPTLWQMTSTVEAELRPETALQEIFRALFPCGSITGAPKVRAMQLIAALEGQPRGVYCGSIGYIAPTRAEFSVAIRTLEFHGHHGRMGIGGGIVIDSEPESEYAECLLKARFLTEPAPSFQLIETMLWQSEGEHAGFPLLALHLDRLADSAAYFGFSCDRVEVEASLLAHTRSFTDQVQRRVRLLLGSDGALEISSTPIQPDAGNNPVRVRISPERTDPADPFYFHKTTHRPLYARAFEQAQRDGFGEVLFFNTRGELTEGAISNVFVVKDGLWFTPPIACGLLDGVQRRQLLATRPEIEEHILTEDDLRTADAVWLSNAVRGLLRAEILWE
ncbi:MAG: aminodeoxychorismate synthase component I [Terracidiphilus sp.]|nr:aminodeoxychorismate synthase component I [Terracidiphilus sp.]